MKPNISKQKWNKTLKKWFFFIKKKKKKKKKIINWPGLLYLIVHIKLDIKCTVNNFFIFYFNVKLKWYRVYSK